MSSSLSSASAVSAARAFSPYEKGPAAKKALVSAISRKALLDNPHVLNSIKYDRPEAYFDVYPKGIKLFTREASTPSPLTVDSLGKESF
jgi:hypothetical protein